MTRSWWTAAAVVLAATVAAEIAFHDPDHSFYWWHGVPAFDFVLGAAGCAALIAVSKALASAWLRRPEGYYGGGDDA